MPLFSKYSDQQFEQLQTERDTVRSERDAALGKATTLQQANELLLSQLHQVQEELGTVSLKSKQFEEAASQAAAKLKAETDAKNAEAGKARAEAARANAEANRANVEAAKAKTEVDQRAAAERQVADLQAKLKTETDAKNAEAGKAQAEAAKAKDLQEENDLLLAQLHQVQEELERYYLKNKDLESSVGEVTTSLRNARYALINAKLTGTLAPQKLLASG